MLKVNLSQNTFFSADHHLQHFNVIKYSKRPFSSVREMNDCFLKNWNETIGKNDNVIYLGDICAGNPSIGRSYIEQLNGKIFYLCGNHEAGLKKFQHRFETTDDVGMVNIGGQEIWCSHYAHRVWPKSHYNVWHTYGHSHASLYDDPNSKSFDIGIDSVAKYLGGQQKDYRPISFFELKEIMDKKIFKPIDHHKSKQDEEPLQDSSGFDIDENGDRIDTDHNMFLKQDLGLYD